MRATSYIRVLAVACAALIPVPQAAALSCPIRTADQEIAALDLVFIGSAVKVEDAGDGKTRTAFRVEEVLLGAPMSAVEIDQDAENGVEFKTDGSATLVGAVKDGDRYRTSLCTNPLSSEAEIRDALQKAQKTP